ncbi:MAG: apolipoprotein N-acyltransferase [Pirellulales bacterium]|nr:apolipoprotein N-acyltransferase [Pirellulales bacterium]
MNGRTESNKSLRPLVTALASAVLIWLAQPPCGLWPLALVALVPWLTWTSASCQPGRREYWRLYLVASAYWLLTLQGLRHAHPVMYACWIALAGYLGIYPVLFVMLVRRTVARKVPLGLAAPVVWVGLECARGYLFTGLSAALLGHTLVDVPEMIQIADLFGTYGVSFVLVSANVAVFALIGLARRQASFRATMMTCAMALGLIITTYGYGRFRLQQDRGQPLATFALIQRNEPVEYGQPRAREAEISQNYTRQTLAALSTSEQVVDVVVWPESMFTGRTPWVIADTDAVPPEFLNVTREEFHKNIPLRRQVFLERVAYMQYLFSSAQPSAEVPHLLVGCGVIHFKQSPHVFSGVVHLDRRGEVADWYGKTHLVMFGEYVPLVSHIPGVRSLVPPGLGLQTGPGVKQMMVDQTAVSPNICIETAIERVTINQIATLNRQQTPANVIVTVSNDGWFDDSSVIDHHLRCAQLVAVGCRRPVLSAANNGPTAWIDSCGRLVKQLPRGTNGAIIASPRLDQRSSLYTRIGDWPARFLTLLCVLFAVDGWVAHRRRRRELAGS